MRRKGVFLFQGKDAHFLRVESLCLFDPSGNCGWNGGHGEDHGGELLV